MYEPRCGTAGIGPVDGETIGGHIASRQRGGSGASKIGSGESIAQAMSRKGGNRTCTIGRRQGRAGP